MKRVSKYWMLWGSVLALLIMGLSENPEASMLSAKDTFQVGEILPYEVKWTGIPCGEIKLSIKKRFMYEGEDVFHFMLTAESNVFLSTFYKVRDTIESYAQSDELYSLRYVKKLQEGNYVKDQVVLYDPVKGEAHYQESSGQENIKVSIKAKDTLAVFYLFRMMDLKVGSKKIFNVDSNKKHYRLIVEVVEKEKIEIRNHGVFDTTRVEVDVVRIKNGIEEDMTENGIVLWMLDDPNKTPVRIRTQVFLGKIDMILKPEYLP